MKRRLSKKLLALFVALAMVLGMSVFAMAEPDPGNELYAEFTPDELSFDVEKGSSETLTSAISAAARYYSDDSYAEDTYISAYTAELVSATAPDGGNLAGINPMQYITVDRGTTMSILTVDIRPGDMPEGSYVWMLTTIVTGDWEPCDSDPVYIYLNVTGGSDDGVFSVSCDPTELNIKVKEGYDNVSPQEVKISVKSKSGNELPFMLGGCRMITDIYPVTASFKEYVVCENSSTGGALSVSLKPGLPKGKYVFRIYPLVGYEGIDVGAPFTVNVTVSAGDTSGALVDPTTGETVDYSLKDNAVSLSGDVSPQTPVYVAVFNENQQLVSIEVLTAPGSAIVSGGSTAKLIWVDADGFIVKCEAPELDLS